MPRKFSEDQTRKQMIDPQLEHAGWYLRDHSKVKIEIPVDGYDKEPWNGVSDYCLYRENGEVLAVVEAKKTAVAEKIHQMDEKLKIEFQLVEQRLGHHRQTLTTLMRSIKKAPVSQ